MVYCGKPSMGCETCRKRRIKCDETKPVCNQCTKSRRHCSGYRSAFDILHRDETHATKKRAKKAEAKKAAKRAAVDGGGAIDFTFVQFDANAPDAGDEGEEHEQHQHLDNVKREVSPPRGGAAAAAAATAAHHHAASPSWNSGWAYSYASSSASSSSSPGPSPTTTTATTTTVALTCSTPHTTSSPSPLEPTFFPPSHSHAHHTHPAHPLLFPPPAAAPAMPLDQHASHYFASHFIMLPGAAGQRGVPRRGHLDYLVPFLRTETDPRGPFQLAYSACGLAALSNRERSAAGGADLTALSFVQHTRAMRAIGAALRDPERCKTDATLAAVQLLCFFEKITATQETGLTAWRTHSEGAIHIIKQRGRDASRGQKYSVQLFNAVRLDIIARTLSSGTAPSGGADWWLQESEIGDPTGPRFQRFALEISDLRAEVTRLMTVLPRSEQGIDIMLEMLHRIHDLDRKIANWLATLPEDYQYGPLYWEEDPDEHDQQHDQQHEHQHQQHQNQQNTRARTPPLSHRPVFPGRVDVYHDVVAASMLNGVRASRIILASILIRCAAWICSPADYRATPEYATAVRTIRDNIAAIVSSIPFMMSTLPPAGAGGSRSGSIVAGSFLCGADEQAKMVGGLMASWPLSTVRTCDFTTDAQREWAVGRLNSIANDLGIKYASTLANARVRFPSMLISRDGLMSPNDPLRNYKVTLADRTISAR